MAPSHFGRLKLGRNHIGLDFGRLTTLRDLKHGLRALLTTRREREGQELADRDFEGLLFCPNRARSLRRKPRL